MPKVWMLVNPLAMFIFCGVALAALGGLVAHRNKMLNLASELVFQEEPEPVVQTRELVD